MEKSRRWKGLTIGERKERPNNKNINITMKKSLMSTEGIGFLQIMNRWERVQKTTTYILSYSHSVYINPR